MRARNKDDAGMVAAFVAAIVVVGGIMVFSLIQEKTTLTAANTPHSDQSAPAPRPTPLPLEP